MNRPSAVMRDPQLHLNSSLSGDTVKVTVSLRPDVILGLETDRGILEPRPDVDANRCIRRLSKTS